MPEYVKRMELLQKEIRQENFVLENELNEVLFSFSKRTGLSVYSIEINRNYEIGSFPCVGYHVTVLSNT
ncbi:MAG: hypothetical protein M0R03_16840 [Novosphingobium sp.]|nr:hypothetical protein [Novosphingobium sp.]